MTTKKKKTNTPCPPPGDGGEGAAAAATTTTSAAPPASSPNNDSSKSPVEAQARWADAHLGRPGALVANGVFAAASGATRVVGFTCGDPNLHVKSKIRALIPMHLRVSARVHHVAFYHPSLDAEIAAPQESRGKRDKIGTAIKKTLGLEDGADGDDKANAAQLVAALESEQRRLSRDGIVEHHMSRAAAERRRSSRSIAAALAAAAAADEDEDAGRGGEGDSSSAAVAGPARVRRFVVASRIPQSAGSKRSAEGAPEEIFRHVLKKGRGDVDAVRSAVGLSSGGNQKYLAGLGRTAAAPAGGRITLSARASDVGDATDGTIAFDEDGVTGDGPVLAALIKGTEVARIGRFLPEVACRVPSSAVGFELRNDQRRVQSTQPFVVEAPHVIWGGGGDRVFCRVAADGNPLIDARSLEYLSNNDLGGTERTESLLCTGATVWVDTPEEIRKDAKTAGDVAKNAAQTVGKALTKTAEAGSKGVEKVEKGVAKTAAAGNKGAKKIRNVFKFKRKEAKGTAEEGHEDEDEVAPSDELDVDSVVEDAEGFADGNERPSFERVPGKISLTGRKTVIDSQTIDKETKGSGKRDEGKKSQEAVLSSPAPYVLVLDDVIDFRVVDFPSSNVMATFPISVASVLNSRSLEDRLDNPLRPSSLTVTLVQEPSIKENQWGVEVKVTFRVVEVNPDTPLAAEKPELDESGRWSKSNVDKKMKRLGTHLKNIGKSREEIEEKIRAAKEKEEAEEEALDAAIVAAGLGKGYEQGAPWKEIVRRQMFYDPEREAVRRNRREYGSGDIQAKVLANVGLHSRLSHNDSKQVSLFDVLDQKIPSHVFASQLKEGDAQQTDAEGYGLSTPASEPSRVDPVIAAEESDFASGKKPLSPKGSKTTAGSVAERDAIAIASESTKHPEESMFMSAKEAVLPIVEGSESASEDETQRGVFLSAKESISSVKELHPKVAGSESASEDETQRDIFLSAKESISSVKELRPKVEGLESASEDETQRDMFLSAKESISSVNELHPSSSASKVLRINTLDVDSDRGACTSTRVSSDPSAQDTLFKSAVQSIEPDLGDMDVTHSTTLSEVDAESFTLERADTSRQIEIDSKEQVSIQEADTSGGTERVEGKTKSKKPQSATLMKESSDENISPLIRRKQVTIQSRATLQVEAISKPTSLRSVSEESPASLISETSPKREKDVLSASQSRNSRRRSVHSLALMQMSLGGVKGLVGESEFDLFRQIASLGEEGPPENGGKVAKDLDPEVDITDSTQDGRLDKVLASWAFGFTEHCKHIFLEEYPGLLLGLCTVCFLLVVRWTFFTANA